eukprot:gene44849-59861_t
MKLSFPRLAFVLSSALFGLAQAHAAAVDDYPSKTIRVVVPYPAGGIADKIVAFARSLGGHWKGGLGLANVVASTLFGGVSGSPVADTSAMGGVMIPIMKREGYSAAYAVNVTTHASLSGALMPTSHNMIIYAFAAQAAVGTIDGHIIKGVSIGDLMFAGLIP